MNLTLSPTRTHQETTNTSDSNSKIRNCFRNYRNCCIGNKICHFCRSYQLVIPSHDGCLYYHFLFSALLQTYSISSTMRFSLVVCCLSLLMNWLSTLAFLRKEKVFLLIFFFSCLSLNSRIPYMRIIFFSESCMKS
jgi:hypothetical protein